MDNSYKDLVSPVAKLRVEQVWESFEIAIGWETRNKYRILGEDGLLLGFAAEQSTGLSGTILRQMFGHWRAFNLFVFNQHRQQILDLHFPFRWFFKTLSVQTAQGQLIGTLEQRFALFYKKFDVLDSTGKVLATIQSPLWKMWTFELQQNSRKLGTIKKKWSGVLGEFFTDKDNFEICFDDPNLSPELKALMLGTCFMLDIVYFEKKGNSN